MKKIIAILGMCGSGKSEACKYLDSLGYKIVYFGGITMEKLAEEGLEKTPENEKMMREKLRKEYGMGAYAILNLPKIREFAQNSNVVLDGVYSWDEIKILEKEFDLLKIALVVDKKIRYDRLKIRNPRPLTKEEAINRDISEIENSAKGGPIAYADYYIDNNGTIDDIKKRIDEILKEDD